MMANIILTHSNLNKRAKEFGINWFKAYVNRSGCLPKKVFCYSTNIIAN